MNNELIVVRQLPVIEEQLRIIQADIESRVNKVLALTCTEDTYKEVKRARSDLSKEYAELEKRRKEVKASILAPYEQFERVYKRYAGDIYTAADAKLKARITEVEDGLKLQKDAEVEAYFNEYRTSLGIDEDFIGFSASGIKATLSDSRKALKEKAKTFLDRIAGELALIDTQEHKDEILVEYRKTLNVSQAVTTVTERHKAMEEEHRRREAMTTYREATEQAAAIVEDIAAVTAPVTVPAVVTPGDENTESATPPQTFSTEFRVFGTLTQLKALKNFLNDGGYTYEQL